jgi:tRNA-2-methylthio-N6-dimethylallyladenosine synthase
MGSGRRYHVTTFGCQMNVHDSERMQGMLESLGYEEAASRDEADLILFNTCSIRESADSRFVAHLGEAKRLKSEDSERLVGVGGCWAQSVKDEVFERFPFVDVAFGPGQIHKLAEFLNSDSLTAQGYFEFEDFSGHLPTRREREFQGWLQISQGCNCKCAYCIVPSTRGREVSRDPGELIVETEVLAADGVREITLLGQNVNSYGRDLPVESRIGFSELLARIDAVEGIDRIRYTSPHPKDMKEDVIRAHAELSALCEHIHLPLQSGSSTILKRMRRTYDRRRYMDRVALIREHVPDCAITTDVIVGFPGESEADFEQTMEVVEEVGYDGAFTFIFSPRRETEAAEMEDQVPHPVKRERLERLVELVQRRAEERAQRFVGREVEVLVEGPSRTDPTRLRGKTRHNKTVNFDGDAEPGELVTVEITEATSMTLGGVSAKPLTQLLPG